MKSVSRVVGGEVVCKVSVGEGLVPAGKFQADDGNNKNRMFVPCVGYIAAGVYA